MVIGRGCFEGVRIVVEPKQSLFVCLSVTSLRRGSVSEGPTVTKELSTILFYRF